MFFNYIIDKINECGGIPVGIFPSRSIDYYNKKICDIPNMTINEIKDINRSLSIVEKTTTNMIQKLRPIFA